MFTVYEVVTNIWLNIRTFVIRKPFLSLQNVLIFRENFCLVFYSCNVQFRRVSINFMQEVDVAAHGVKNICLRKKLHLYRIYSFATTHWNFRNTHGDQKYVTWSLGVVLPIGYTDCQVFLPVVWIGSPLSPPRECGSSPPWVQGGRNTRLRGGGWGSWFRRRDNNRGEKGRSEIGGVYLSSQSYCCCLSLAFWCRYNKYTFLFDVYYITLVRRCCSILELLLLMFVESPFSRAGGHEQLIWNTVRFKPVFVKR